MTRMAACKVGREREGGVLNKHITSHTGLTGLSKDLPTWIAKENGSEKITQTHCIDHGRPVMRLRW